MDDFDKLIKDEFNRSGTEHDLDVESILLGIKTKIHKRANRRKAIYSGPVIALLLMLVYVIMPSYNEEPSDPGGELLMAGWETSWIESQSIDFEDAEDLIFYEESVDYLFDDHFSYSDDGDELLTSDDLQAFRDYLEEV